MMHWLSKSRNELNLPITVENHFKYLVLLPQKSGEDFGAINRYYGLRYDGELVCRGIELRRRNTAQVYRGYPEASHQRIAKQGLHGGRA